MAFARRLMEDLPAGFWGRHTVWPLAPYYRYFVLLCCRFGNFLCNNIKERQTLSICEKALSLWAHLDAMRGTFLNPTFRQTSEVGDNYSLTDPLVVNSGGVGAVVRSLPPNPKVPGSIAGLAEGWISVWPSFPPVSIFIGKRRNINATLFTFTSYCVLVVERWTLNVERWTLNVCFSYWRWWLCWCVIVVVCIFNPHLHHKSCSSCILSPYPCSFVCLLFCKVLLPASSPRRLQLWADYFLRFDETAWSALEAEEADRASEVCCRSPVQAVDRCIYFYLQSRSKVMIHLAFFVTIPAPSPQTILGQCAESVPLEAALHGGGGDGRRAKFGKKELSTSNKGPWWKQQFEGVPHTFDQDCSFDSSARGNL